MTFADIASVLEVKRTEVIDNFKNAFRKIPSKILQAIENENNVSLSSVFKTMIDESSPIDKEGVLFTVNYTPACRAECFVETKEILFRGIVSVYFGFAFNYTLFGKSFRAYSSYDKYHIDNNEFLSADTGLKGYYSMKTLQNKIDKNKNDLAKWRKHVRSLENEEDFLAKLAPLVLE